MRPLRTFPTTPPLGREAPRYAGATLLDSFGILLPKSAPCDAGRLARLALLQPPSTFKALMVIRDHMMANFGVKTSGDVRTREGGGQHIDFFPVLSESDREVEVGLDDVHLDFRAWMTITEQADGLLFQSTTAATAHNLLGRAYLTLIGPFHVAVVRSSLRRAATRLEDPAWRTRAFDPDRCSPPLPPVSPRTIRQHKRSER